MSGYEKAHRPEREYAERSAEKRPASPLAVTEDHADQSAPREARLWQSLEGPRGIVQRRSAGDGAAAAPRTVSPNVVAENGVASATERLPHHEHIQRSFGRHDVSRVRVQTGGSAAEASRGLGASAYAVGDRVGFASAPDLHTAAHEAAHVVQQRGGVQLKGGIDGGKSDAHEQHADAVADKVVRGESAESLLDAAAPAGAQTRGASSSVVQRKSTSAEFVSATEYLRLNNLQAGQAIGRHLLEVALPPPHPRLAWNNLRAFYNKLFKQLDRVLYVFDDAVDLAQLVYPQDPYAVLDAVRPVVGRDKESGKLVGTWDWYPSVGVTLAQLVEETLIGSLYRLGPRWLANAERGGSVSGKSVYVDPDSIPRSHSMDRAVVPAMCEAGVFDVQSDKRAAQPKPRSSPAHIEQPVGLGLRPVKLTWMKTPELWNWVHADSPTDATVEEVAATLFKDTAESHNETNGDYLAFAMTAAPPLFGLPGHWAIKFDEAKAHAPTTVSAQTDDAASNVVVLAGSSAADDQALLEAGVRPDAHAAPGAKRKSGQLEAPAHGSTATVAALIEDTRTQASYLKTTLTSWALSSPIEKALAFLTRRQAELSDPSTAAKWQPVLAGQKDLLARIGSGIVELDRAATSMNLKRGGEDGKALRDIVALYADAAGTSHLIRTSETLIQRAAAQQSMLSLRGVQGAARDLSSSVDVLRESAPDGDDERKRLNSAATKLDDDSRQLQSRMIRGDKVDPEEIEKFTLNAGEISLKSKVHSITVQLAALEQAAHDADDGFWAAIASLFSGDFRALENSTSELKSSLEMVTQDMDWQAKSASLGFRVENAKDLDDYYKDQTRVRKQALATAQTRLEGLAGNNKIRDFLQKGASLVKWQSFRTACVKLAALIGVSIVGGAIGGMIARGIGGALMSSAGVATMEDLSFGAQMVARGTGLVTETVVTSAGQAGIFGDKFSDAFLENMIMNLGSAGVLKMIGSKAEEAVRLEKATAGFWQKAAAGGKFVLKESAAITGHTIMGVAMGYVAHKLVTGQSQPPPETLEEWMMQGAAIAVGRYVGKAMEASHARQQKLKLQGFDPETKLAADSEKLAELAKRAEDHPQAKDAMELLEKRHQLLTEEMSVLDKLEKSPEAMKKAGLNKREIAKAKAELGDQLDDVHSQGFGEVALHASGMKELIPGALWTGSYEDVNALVVKAKESGIQATATKDPQGGRWHVNIEGRDIVVEERATSEGPVKSPSPSPATGHDPKAGATSTKAGAVDDHASQKPGERKLENAPAVSERANGKLKALAAPERARIEEIFSHAENTGQRTLLERAFAAGRGPTELAELQTAMTGKSAGEVAKQFSGTGVVQFYEQSCVPTAYQIAVAEVDPYFAYELRKNPKLVMQEQRDVLIDKGAAQTKRTDVRKGRPVENIKEHLDDPEMGPRLKGDEHYSPKGDTGGIETTQMPGSTLQTQLEKATGSTYEILTDDRVAYDKSGHGQYAGGSPPHQAIAAAVAAGKPVIVATRAGSTSHAQVIVGRTTSSTGESIYQIIDPYSGKMSEFPEAALDWFGAHSVSLPKEFANIAKIPPAPHAAGPSGGGMKSGGAGEIKLASDFLAKLRASNPKVANEFTASGYKPESFGDTPHVLQFLEKGPEITQANQMKGFVGKTGLDVDAALRLFDQLLQLHPLLDSGGVKKFGNAVGQMAQQRASLSCPVDVAIRTAIDLSAHPRYAGDPATAVGELRGLITDNISPEVAMQELVRPLGVGDEIKSARVAGPNKPAPDASLETVAGKSVGREMQVVGPKVDTAANAGLAEAKAELENALAKAIKDKAVNFTRSKTPDFDSQEIIIQIKPSKHGYNYDTLLNEAALFDRVVPRAFASDDYTRAVAEAKTRIANGDKDQPKVTAPDRVRIYDSTGTLKYSR